MASGSISSVQFSSVHFSQSIMSESLQPHELHHARNPCPSTTPRVCSNSFPFIKKKIWGSKITTDGDCGHEIKRCLFLGRKVMTNLDSIFKSRDITLPTKVRLVKGIVLPVVVYGCESWTVKKAEHRRIDAFELWYWIRLLRVPWTARRSNQSILKEISPGCSSKEMMLKLKLQYFGHVMRRFDSLENL